MRRTTISIIAILAIMSCTTKNEQDLNKPVTQMKIDLPKDSTHFEAWNKNFNSMYTVFVSPDVVASREFYTKWFGYSIVFESSWFVLLASPGGHQSQIAFISEEHPSSPPSPKVFSGNGAFLTLDVKEAKILYEVMQQAGIEVTYKLTDEPWGQRRFAVTDPSGIWIDVVQQIQPAQGWWDKNY
jgi:catechol 2,3-dioxygenase-like lactoylglutathione lyase family enzyme